MRYFSWASYMTIVRCVIILGVLLGLPVYDANGAFFPDLSNLPSDTNEKKEKAPVNTVQPHKVDVGIQRKKKSELRKKEAASKKMAEDLKRRQQEAITKSNELTAEANEKARLEKIRDEQSKTRQKSGQPFSDCDVCPQMMVVPPGNFMMGERNVKADFVYEVAIAKPFAVSLFAVSLKNWNACVQDKQCGDRGYVTIFNRSLPVTSISWQDAQIYLTWLKYKSGQHYRLLSESEWEYVAMANSVDPDVPKTNTFGINDIASSSIWEWVADCPHSDYHRAPTTGKAWLTDCKVNDRKVLRKGKKNHLLQRDDAGLDEVSGNFGFRVARDL